MTPDERKGLEQEGEQRRRLYYAWWLKDQMQTFLNEYFRRMAPEAPDIAGSKPGEYNADGERLTPL